MILYSNQSTGHLVPNTGGYPAFDPNTIFTDDMTEGGGGGSGGGGGGGTTLGMTSSTIVDGANLIGSGTGSTITSTAGSQSSNIASGNSVDQSSTYSLNLGSGMISKGGVFNGISQVQGPTSIVGQNQQINQSQSQSQSQSLGKIDSGVSLLSSGVGSETRDTTVLSLKRKAEDACESSN